MKALTLRSPWAFAIAYLGKPIENREWDDRLASLLGLPDLIGQQIAIHSGAAPQRPKRARAALDLSPDNLWRQHCEALEWIRGTVPELPDVALEYLARRCPDGLLTPEAFILSGVVAVATLGKPVRDSRSPWAIPGHLHLPLLDVQVLPEPVQCGGAQGFWELPEVIGREVELQLSGTRAPSTEAEIQQVWGNA